jgi:hypothetical protein
MLTPQLDCLAVLFLVVVFLHYTSSPHHLITSSPHHLITSSSQDLTGTFARAMAHHKQQPFMWSKKRSRFVETPWSKKSTQMAEQAVEMVSSGGSC